MAGRRVRKQAPHPCRIHQSKESGKPTQGSAASPRSRWRGQRRGSSSTISSVHPTMVYWQSLLCRPRDHRDRSVRTAGPEPLLTGLVSTILSMIESDPSNPVVRSSENQAPASMVSVPTVLRSEHRLTSPSVTPQTGHQPPAASSWSVLWVCWLGRAEWVRDQETQAV